MLRCPSIAGFRFSNMNIWNSIFSSLHPYVESNQPLFRALSPHAPLLWDCHCGSRNFLRCSHRFVLFVNAFRLVQWWAESFSSWRWFGVSEVSLIGFLGQKHICSKQPHSGMSRGKFWEATVILEKLLLCNKIWWDVSILSNTMRFGNYSCFFF